MKLYNIFFLLCFILNASHLYAKKYEYNGNCKFSGYMDNFEHCLDKELILYDKELNRVYKRLSPNKDLIKTEKLWIKFKEADCEYMAREVHEGLEYSVIYRACLINKTKARISDLKRSYFYVGWFE